MKIVAGEWYQNVDVWAIVVASVVSLLVGWLGAWAAFRSANPKLRLNWWVRVNSPLIPPPYASSRITVNAAGVVLAAPRIVELELTNAGRKDIVSSMFHNGDTLIFDLGVPIVTLIGLTSDPDGASPVLLFPPPKPNQFEVEPSHIARGQTVAIRLLVDGSEVTPRLTRKPLVDVSVVETAPREMARSFVEALGQAAWIAVVRR